MRFYLDLATANMSCRGEVLKIRSYGNQVACSCIMYSSFYSCMHVDFTIIVPQGKFYVNLKRGLALRNVF